MEYASKGTTVRQEEKKQAEVYLSIEELDKAIGLNSELTIVLIDRLTTIISGNPPTEECQNVMEVRCQLAEDIRRLKNPLEKTNEKIKHVLEFLQI